MFIQTFDNESRCWQRVAQLDFRQPDAGIGGPTRFAYDLEYAADHSEATPVQGVSVNYPVNFELHGLNTWPAFALDLLPAGFARQQWLVEIDQADGPRADVSLLTLGACNPPGNLRSEDAAERLVGEPHPGFPIDAIIERREGFIEYARARGAPVAGSTGAQGEAPKFLILQDASGRWHADGAIADTAPVRGYYLVKFPRGRRSEDEVILRHEALYHGVALHLGLRVHPVKPTYRNPALFIPRFDRDTDERGIIRHGMESLAAACGLALFGGRRSHEQVIDHILRVSTTPQADVIEYFCRDIANIALGNTDNHLRNQAFLKTDDSACRLAPVYDFAPMFLDPEGIARSIRWDGDREQLGRPNWRAIQEYLETMGIEAQRLQLRMAQMGQQLQTVAPLLRATGADDDFVRRLEPRIAAVLDNLEAI